MNAAVARKRSSPAPSPTAAAASTPRSPERSGCPVSSASTPSALIAGTIALHTEVRREIAWATAAATGPPQATARVNAPITPPPSTQEAHLRRQLRGERGDHGEVEEAGGRLHRARAVLS